MCPITVRSEETLPSAKHWVLRAKCSWDVVAKMLLDENTKTSLVGDHVGILGFVVDLIQPNSIDNKHMSNALSRVPRRRCVRCNAYDKEGRRDPLDQKWLCRFCWEATLFEGSLLEEPGDDSSMIFADAGELQTEL